jgi:hypothetical protein
MITIDDNRNQIQSLITNYAIFSFNTIPYLLCNPVSSSQELYTKSILREGQYAGKSLYHKREQSAYGT